MNTAYFSRKSDETESPEFFTDVQCICGETIEFEYHSQDSYGNQQYKADCSNCGQKYTQLPSAYKVIAEE